MVEKKVTAATLGAATAGLVVWIVGEYVFHGDTVPGPVEGFLALAVPGLVAFVAGYVTKHTWRPDLGDTAPQVRPGTTLHDPGV